jgi:hypothetical protein
MSDTPKYSEQELNIIFQALNIITIQGKDARLLAKLMDKIEGELSQIRSSKLEPPKSTKK